MQMLVQSDCVDDRCSDQKKGKTPGKTYEVDSHFEKALDNDPAARLKMEAQRVRRNNPFTKLKRQNTVQALKAMQQIQETTVKLPRLESWLEKQRKKKGTKTYQRRWVVVKVECIDWMRFDVILDHAIVLLMNWRADEYAPP